MALKIRHLLACGVAAAALPSAAGALAQTRAIDVPSEEAAKSIPEFARQENVQIIAPVSQLHGIKTQAVSGSMDLKTALGTLISGTGLEVANNDGAVIILRRGVATAAGDTAPAGADQANLTTETVVVTGSRIRVNGNDLPTPVTVVSAAQLQATTPSDIPDGLNKLPTFAGRTTSNTNSGGGSGKGSSPTGNFLDIRGLGPIRTLVLLDGKRVPGTYYDSTVDTNMLPQMLIQRVEVVTGGASAVYGSDAIAGVVNFILDTKFDGLKGLMQAGISNYGDAKSFRAGIAGGEDIGSHGHLLWSLEYYDRDQVPDFGTRPYGYLDPEVVGAGTTSSPYYVVPSGLRRANLAYGGLVTSGPFNGQQFGPGGVLEPFNPGVPTATANYSVGGDGAVENNQTLVPVIGIAQGFGRFDYDFSGDTKGYIQTSYAQSRTYSVDQSLPLYATAYPLTIYSGNAFLTPAEQAVLTATNTSSFSMGIYDPRINQHMSFVYQTGALTVQTGLSGTLFDRFNWDAYYTHGQTRTSVITHRNVNGMRLYAALDAVKDPTTGNTVCRVSLTAPGAYPGCAPINFFGEDSASNQALDYITGETSWAAHNGLDDFGANVTGPIFNGPAGPIQVAVGGEYRMQSLVVTTSVPNNGPFDPQYLRGGADGKTFLAKNLAWVKEFQSAATGSEDVYEGDVEINAPLLKNLPLIELLSFNGAYRYTDYSISGSANTWKIGLEWQVFDDLRIRATRSRDFRAPTLWDLYQMPSNSSSGYTDQLTHQNLSTAAITGGNPNLVPEVARNTTAGIVYSPSWLPNFSATIDYFHIAIDNAIGQVSGSTPSVQSICINSGGTSPLCGLIVRPFPISNTTPANFPTSVYTVNENVSHVYAEGVDFEVNYETDLSGWSGMNGVVNLRGLWSHEPTYKTQAIAGAPYVNAAGTAQTPSDRATFILDYKLGHIAFDALERYESAFHYNGDPTLVYTTPEVRAYFQTDINIAYDFIAADVPLTSFLSINNLFDVSGGVYANTGTPGQHYPTAPGADIIGRYYTIGLRFRT